MKIVLVRSLLFWMLFLCLLPAIGKLLAFVPGGPSKLLYALLCILAVFFLTWLFLKNQKTLFKDVGLVWERSSLPKFFMGVLIGTAFIAIVLLVLVSLTELELRRSSNTIPMQIWFSSLMVIIPLAFLEELVFRSYAFLELNKAYGLLWAQFIAAIVFALYHVVGGWRWEVAFLGPFVWAWVFGLAAIWSRGIALPTGIHAALNFLQMVTGMKKGKGSLWVLDLKGNHTIAAEAMANRVGLCMQIFILIAAVVATWLFLKRTDRKRFDNREPIFQKN